MLWGHGIGRFILLLMFPGLVAFAPGDLIFIAGFVVKVSAGTGQQE